MTPRITIVFAVFALAGLAGTASAEDLNLSKVTAARPNLVQARTGLDHGFVLDLGYRRVVEWGGRQFLFGGDLGIPVASPDFNDFRLRVTAAASLLGGGGRGWKLVASLSPTLRGTKNAAGRDQSLGVDVRVTGGYYSRWWLAGELGLDWAATTRIVHDREYRDLVHAGAKDGWYGNTGGTVYAGLNTGVSIRSVDVVARFGVPRGTDLSSQSIPFYALIGVNVALPH